MRHAYLTPNNYEQDGGCRGGVTAEEDYGCCEYEIEIHQRCNASTRMLALCAHYDELMEYLNLCQSPLAQWLLDSIGTEEQRLDIVYDKTAKERRLKEQQQ